MTAWRSFRVRPDIKTSVRPLTESWATSYRRRRDVPWGPLHSAAGWHLFQQQFESFIMFVCSPSSKFSASLSRESFSATVLYTDPNSAIQASYFSRSAAETDLEIFFSVRVKSSMVTGICSSSLDSARISSGLRSSIRRRMAIMEASLMQKQRRTWVTGNHFCSSEINKWRV